MLMVPLLVVVAATAALGLFNAQRETDLVFDRWLLDAAQSLAGVVRFDQGAASVQLPPAAVSMLEYDEVDRVYYAVQQGKVLIAGQRGIPTEGLRMAAYRGGQAFDALIEGAQVRVARVDLRAADDRTVTVLVAETTRKRQGMRRQILSQLWLMAVLLVVAVLAVGAAVELTIRPLERIAARWALHSNASLEPVEIKDAPRELQPFANALNDLLKRIRAVLDRERQFAATAAHQLRTPLAGILLGLDRARRSETLGDARTIIDEVVNRTQRTARLVQQLLVASRLDPEQRAQLHFCPVDLVELVRNVGQDFMQAADGKQLVFEFNEPLRPVEVVADADLLPEAVANLLDNAIRYSPSGGRVEISVVNSPARIIVDDSGPGIPPDERHRIFDRYARGRETGQIGTGLGLAIVRDIADLHSATVLIGNSPLGGTRAEITFPAALGEGSGITMQRVSP